MSAVQALARPAVQAALARDPAAVDRQLGPVRRIVVFRALVLGDMVCATPALRALQRRFPEATLTLVGLPWARDWAARQTCIDDFIAFPGHPSLPESQLDLVAWPAFLAGVRARHFDLAVQLHGSGSVTNALVREWHAGHLAAFHEPDQADPDPGLGMPWPVAGTEVERLLSLVEGLGARHLVPARERVRLDFPLWPADSQEAARVLGSHGQDAGDAGQRYICIHPGSQLPSRRWPVERFAQVADALLDALEAGPAAPRPAIVITGQTKEAELAAALRATMKHPAIDLSGQTTLWALGALIRDAALLVCNDTGVSHIAAALGTPSVVISNGSDARRWSPHDRRLHRVLWSNTPCRPCMHAQCPHDQACAKDIPTQAVLEEALALWKATHPG